MTVNKVVLHLNFQNREETERDGLCVKVIVDSSPAFKRTKAVGGKYI